MKGCCPVCDSSNISTERILIKLEISFGKRGEAMTFLDTCANCKASGDFSQLNDAVVLAKLHELEKEFVAETIAWLTDRMVSAAYFERAFSLPAGRVKKWLIGSFEAEAVALLRLVRVCPWLLSVADSGFDPDVARQEVVHAAVERLASPQLPTVPSKEKR